MTPNPTLHSQTNCQGAPADPQAKTWQCVCLCPTAQQIDNLTDEKEHRTDNKHLAL